LPLTNIREIVLQFSRYLSTPSGYQATSHISEALAEIFGAELIPKPRHPWLGIKQKGE